MVVIGFLIIQVSYTNKKDYFYLLIHSRFFSVVWNGLTLADLLFPWFTWMMGVSIVLSQRALRKKNIRKLSILLKICRRSAILFLLGKL